MTHDTGSRSRTRRPRTGLGWFGVSMLAAAPVIAGAWLFLAAIPVLADGGPHVSTVNSGTSSLTADSCAGCHRAHSAQGEFLLAAASEEALCLSCHGALGTGATTNVEDGVQYVPTGAGDRSGTLLGALRDGGFNQTVIDTGNAARIWRGGLPSSNLAKVRVRPDMTPQAVTSAHLNLAGNGITAPEVAWGNGVQNSGAGPVVSLGCTDCHNPHGNGQYRILTPRPDANALSGTFASAAADVVVTDSPIDPDGDPANGIQNPTKNYTVLQVKGTPGTLSTYLLYASDVLDARGPGTKPWPVGDYSATGGDYWHTRVPWNDRLGALDAPNGVPFGTTTAFTTQMSAWCTSCHTRYYATDAFPSGDAIFNRRHVTTSYMACTTCHVGHGSSAQMDLPAANQPFPNGDVVAGDSRLLKVDGRGTCQLCHDPTDTVTVVGSYSGPSPSPSVP